MNYWVVADLALLESHRQPFLAVVSKTASGQGVISYNLLPQSRIGDMSAWPRQLIGSLHPPA